MSLRPPSSPSPSTSPGPGENGRTINSRQSLGPVPTSARGTPGLPPGSPRPGASARPTSEMYVPNSAMFQTPEAEALDQWFENLQSYEATLEEMAAASLDVNFKEELSAIEQWFKVLSEAERTAALYSLLQHSSQVQIRFFITVLQQMARADPMTALLSPSMGGASMQSQMESKLASLSLKSGGLPASPTTRAFNRQSLGPMDSPSFLSPDSAALGSAKEDPAGMLMQQRNKLKASNAAHRISAPVLSSGGRDAWGPSGGLSQVQESQGSPSPEIGSRPKSSDFSGSPHPPSATLPSATLGPDGSQTVNAENSWASMVNTPLIPMFQRDANRANRVAQLEQANTKLNDWSSKGPIGQVPGVPRMADPPANKRRGPGPVQGDYDEHGPFGSNNRNRNNGATWSGSAGRGQGRFGAGGSPEEAAAALQQMQALMAAGGMGSPNGLNMGMLAGMNPMTNPFGMNMNMNMLLSPEARLLAAQMAAGGFGQPGMFGLAPPNSASSRRSGPPSGRSTTGGRSPGTSTGGATPRGEEDVDPAMLNDIPNWLRTLRLHKYTPNFEGMRWQDMVMMDDAALEAKGVAALGARRKMLKTFELVRKKMGIEGGPPSSPPSAIL